RKKHFRPYIYGDPAMAHVPGHADDFDPGLVRVDPSAAETFSERALARPIPPGELFVHDGDGERSRGVGHPERPPLKQGDVHRAEIVGRDDDSSNSRLLAWRGARPALHGHEGPRVVAAHRKRAHRRRGAHARNSGETLEQGIVEGARARILRELAL